MKIRRFAVAAAIALTVAGTSLNWSAPAFAATTLSPSTTAASPASATAAYLDTLLPMMNVMPGWTGTVVPCDVGTVSTDYQAAIFQGVNYYRAMAGLNSVAEDTTLSGYAQQAALIQQANPSMWSTAGVNPHFPPTTATCYTTTGGDASGKSNLFWASGEATAGMAIAGYMDDSDSHNAAEVGHRQWILDPFITTMGSGATSNSQALYWDGATNTSNPNPALIPWPSPGYFPWPLLDGLQFPGFTPLSQTTAWSVQSTSADFTLATVSVTKNGTPVSVGALSTTGGPDGQYGDSNALIWQMPALTAPAAGATDTYVVTVSGISGAADSTYTYKVFVYNPYDVSITSVAISGTAQLGSTLTATPSGVSPSVTDGTVLKYQWTADGANVGTNSSTYVPSASDIGKTIDVTVTGTNTGSTYTGSATALPTAAVLPGTITPGTVTIPSTAQVGTQLTATPGGTWTTTPASGTLVPTYAWMEGTTQVGTGLTYTPTAADLGKTLQVVATGTKAGYTTATAQSGTVTVDPGVITIGTVTITGTNAAGAAPVGQALTANVASFTPSTATLSYQWTADGANVGTDAATYTPTPDEVGQTIAVQVSGTLTGYAGSPVTSTNSPQVVNGALTTVTPTISGVVAVDQTLTANAGTWGPTGVSLTYEWFYSDGTDTGVAGTSYPLTKDDLGKQLYVEVTGTLTPGYDPATLDSASTAAVAADWVTAGTVAITGTPTVGQPLTATTSGWSPSAVVLTYQWTANGVNVGTNAPTYTPTPADFTAGAVISVQVVGNYTDPVSGAAYAASAPATATVAGNAPVAAAPFTTAPVPVITGTPQAGQTLTADTGTWSPAATLTYQWYSDGNLLVNASDATLPLTDAEVGHQISVVVTGVSEGYVTTAQQSAMVVPSAAPANSNSGQSNGSGAGSGAGASGNQGGSANSGQAAGNGAAAATGGSVVSSSSLALASGSILIGLAVAMILVRRRQLELGVFAPATPARRALTARRAL